MSNQALEDAKRRYVRDAHLAIFAKHSDHQLMFAMKWASRVGRLFQWAGALLVLVVVWRVGFVAALPVIGLVILDWLHSVCVILSVASLFEWARREQTKARQ